MIRNYFKTAFRSFLRHKVFTAINLLGLSVGISASLVIYLIVHYELSFDKFEKDGDRIYRVVSIMQFPDQPFKNSGVPAPLPAVARNEVPGLEDASHFILYDNAKVAIPSTNAAPKIYKKQDNIIFADDHYFSLFSYQWIAGTPSSFTQLHQVVLSESRARTYFPFDDISQAIGERIIYDDSIEATVVGVVKDLDEITDFSFKEFISFATLINSNLKNNYGWEEWGSVGSASQFFVKLKPGASTSQIENHFVSLRAKYVKDEFLTTDHLLQPLSDLHFNADYGNYNQKQADKSVLYGLLAVAAFLLLLGCINFINLNTAQASQRAKEIGIRKTMGGSKRQLIFQFLSETFLLAFISTLLSLLFIPWLLKIFSDFIPSAINFNMIVEPHVIIFLLVLLVVVTLLAGFYPAMVLSGFQPVTVLKNQTLGNNTKTRKAWLRKSLTVTQFAGAQFFIIATILVSKQIHYSVNKDIGFRKDAIVNIGAPFSKDPGLRTVLMEKLKAIPEIESVTLAGTPPAYTGSSSQTMSFENGDKKIETTVEFKNADEDYFKLYNMKLLAGRFPRSSDTTIEYLINENYARFLGFEHPEDAIGKMLTHNHPFPIVGVLKDFNSKSMRTPIAPLIYTSAARNYSSFHILLKPHGDDGALWQTAISKMRNSWNEVYTEDDFEYRFYDQTIASFYENEKNISRLLSWATALAILISCLGLLGLAIYTTNQRTKEIGVRKVLGATVQQIVMLLSMDFIQLIAWAFLIAVPLAWWAMNKWLDNFAYRTTLDWWVFLSGGSIMLLIALTILCLRTLRAANANPVRALRSE
ncbi:MAG: ABC transporter permease [Chitinophagales bacterium]